MIQFIFWLAMIAIIIGARLFVGWLNSYITKKRKPFDDIIHDMMDDYWSSKHGNKD